MLDISMVVVNYHTYPMIDRFLSSYDQYRPTASSEVVVIDNESTDQVHSLSLPDSVTVLPVKANLGYAKACNLGASLTESRYIGLFNSDTYFVNDACIDRCISFMDSNPDVGVVGPLQYSRAKAPRKFTAAGIIGTHAKPKHRGWSKTDRGEYRDVLEVVMVIGSAMIIRREAWNAIMNDPVFRKHWPNAKGAMPEHFLYYEDTAVCYAMPKFGYKVFHVGDQGAEMVHEWHRTIGQTGHNHLKLSRLLFRELMDDWGIEHD
jgi:GT2 family glycosyltransferase